MSHLHSFVESVVAVVSILPACASFLMALVTFGGAGASYLPYAPAGAGTSPSGGGAGCRLCALIKLLEGMHQEAPDFGPLGSFGSENIWDMF